VTSKTASARLGRLENLKDPKGLMCHCRGRKLERGGRAIDKIEFRSKGSSGGLGICGQDVWVYCRKGKEEVSLIYLKRGGSERRSGPSKSFWGREEDKGEAIGQQIPTDAKD